MTNEKMDTIFQQCIRRYGDNMQIDVAIEEMSELTKALVKWKRSNGKEKSSKARNDIIDELADVRIMMRQMELIFQCEDEVECRIDFKVQRQFERLVELEAKDGEN